MFPQMFGKYVLEREIAVGGMARVFLAKLRGAGGFEKRLVVKQIRTELASQEDFVQRFVAEAKTAVELTHPNIVPVYELGVESGVYYIAMEYCEGVTLADLLRVTGPLSPTEGAHLGAEILSALDYAHRRAGIVHRDVTPRNVLVDEEGAVRLIDFGIATPVRGEGARVFGSPGHMPPEQISGVALTSATDVFAVGALLVEAWTGHAPFRRDTLHESEQALNAAPPRLDDPALAELSEHIALALSLAPLARPQSAEDMARPLRAFTRESDPRDIARALGLKTRQTLKAGRLRDREPSSEQELPLATPVPGTGARTFATRRLPELLLTSSRGGESGSEPQAPEVRGAAESSEPRSLPRRRRLFWFFVAAFSLAGLSVAVALLQPPPPQSSDDVPRTRVPTVTPRGRTVPTSAVPTGATEAGTSRPLQASEPPSTPAPVGLGPRAAPQSAEARGELTLTADPPAQVVVAGRVFLTPVASVRFPVGRYTVRFSHASWPHPVESPVVVVSGGAQHVHADFTREPPRVFVR